MEFIRKNIKHEQSLYMGTFLLEIKLQLKNEK